MNKVIISLIIGIALGKTLPNGFLRYWYDTRIGIGDKVKFTSNEKLPNGNPIIFYSACSYGKVLYIWNNRALIHWVCPELGELTEPEFDDITLIKDLNKI